MRKLVSLLGFRPGPTENRSVQPQKMARSLKLWIKKEEGFQYLCSENKEPSTVLDISSKTRGPMLT